MRDLLNSMQFKRALSPVASAGTDAAWVSQIIDRQGYDSAGFVILTGALPDADATFTVLVEESDDSGFSTSNAVADADLISQTSGTAPETAASFTFAADDNVRKIGYRGTKRYIRLTITPANNAGASLYAAVAVLGHAEHEPVVQAAA